MAQPQTLRPDRQFSPLSLPLSIKTRAALDGSAPGILMVSTILQLKHLQMVNCLKHQWQMKKIPYLYVYM